MIHLYIEQDINKKRKLQFSMYVSIYVYKMIHMLVLYEKFLEGNY